MIITRSNMPYGQINPYTVQFEIIPDIKFSETHIASNALSIRPHAADFYNICEEEVNAWDLLAAKVGACDENTDKKIQTDLQGLKRLGSGLLFYAYSTAEDLCRINSSYPHSNRPFAVRRIEGEIARNMVNAISRRGILMRSIWLEKEQQKNPVGYYIRA